MQACIAHYVEVKRTMCTVSFSPTTYMFQGLNIDHQVLCQLPLFDEAPCQQNKIKTIQQNNPKAWVWRNGLVVSAHKLLTLISKDQTLLLLSSFCGHQAHM